MPGTLPRGIPRGIPDRFLTARAAQRSRAVRLAGDWVFPSRAGTLLSSGSLSAPMRRARKVAKIAHRVTAHGLRRTLDTLAFQVAPSETIRAIMGHRRRR